MSTASTRQRNGAEIREAIRKAACERVLVLDGAMGTMIQDLKLDDAGFRARFSGSPVKRIGRDRFIRNVLIAIGNAEVPALADVVRPLIDDASPLVRAMAVWALGELGGGDALRARATAALHDEPDADVRAEWRRVAG